MPPLRAAQTHRTTAASQQGRGGVGRGVALSLLGLTNAVASSAVSELAIFLFFSRIPRTMMSANDPLESVRRKAEKAFKVLSKRSTHGSSKTPGESSSVAKTLQGTTSFRFH